MTSTLLKCSSYYKPCTRMVTTMTAWRVHSYGDVDKLELNTNIDVPSITAPNEVLIDVHAASLNPVDVMMLKGYGSATLKAMQQMSHMKTGIPDFSSAMQNLVSLVTGNNENEFPIILGRDFSGVVVDTGLKASKEYKPGDEVWGVVNPTQSNKGTHCQFTKVTTCDLSIKPANISHTEAASMPYALLTSWAALTVFGNVRKINAKNKRVLILGGSGGIGTFIIQLLKLWGAKEIVATCSTDALDKVLSLGANIALDYKTHDVLTELELIKGFDLILDGAKTDITQVTHFMNLLKSNSFAHFVTLNSPVLKNNDSYGFPFGIGKSAIDFVPNFIKFAKEGKQYRWGFYMPNKTALKEVAKAVEKEQIVPIVEKVFSFKDTPAAYERIIQGHCRGKCVIDLKK